MGSENEPDAGASFGADEYARLPEVLTAEEAALVLRVSTYQVRQWANAGRVPAVRISNRWRFSKTQLEEFVRGELAAPTSPTPDEDDAAT